MVRNFGQAVPLEKPQAPGQPAPQQGATVLLPRVRPNRFGLFILLAAGVVALFWVGVGAAFLWGYLGAQGFIALDPARKALAVATVLLPPLLFLTIAMLLARAAALAEATRLLLATSDRLFTADDTAAASAARLARVVRRELDGLNTGLDVAFQRMRTLESALGKQISTLDEAGARAQVRSESIAARLNQESARIEGLGDGLTEAASRAGDVMAGRAAQLKASMEAALEKQISTLDQAVTLVQGRSEHIAVRLGQEGARIESLSMSFGDSLTEAAGRAGEIMAGRAAQLKATMESAEGTLKMATQSLDVQTAGFRAAITAASEAPLEAAKTLDTQASRIAEISDSAISRSEFVLARHEKHRSQMSELAEKLKAESDSFESVLSQQRAHMEQAIQALNAQTQKFLNATGDAGQHLDTIMVNAVHHAGQLTNAFVREAERLKETSDGASTALASLAAALKDAGTGAQTLIGESAAQAKQDARLLVGEAMAECDRLLRASGEMSAEASKIRTLLTETTREVEAHLARLPGMAEEEARRVRQAIASEAEQLLDLSARAMSTLHSRSTGRPQAADPIAAPAKPAPEPEAEGLKGLARMLTARKSPERGKPAESKSWEMKTLLAAAEENDGIRLAKSDKIGLNTAATLGALESALADLAIDLSALGSAAPGDEDWKRYLAGDRAVFARRLAGAIDESAVDRITNLYRDDKRFHDTADAYLAEFEKLLARAREGDGGGLLTSTLLSADTGKVYLAIAYALGRL